MAPKQFEYKPILRAQLTRMLQARGEISVREISEATGIGSRHIFMLANDECPSATVPTVESIFQYLKFRGMNPERYLK